MRISIKIILFLALILSCEKNPTSIKISSDQFTISTDKNYYTGSDSIFINIENKSDFDLTIGFRCSYENLEMFYQKQEGINQWSDTLWFDYMSYKCMTLLKKLKSNQTLKHSLFSGDFKSKGKFRLLLPCYVNEKDSSFIIISNVFEIK